MSSKRKPELPGRISARLAKRIAAEEQTPVARECAQPSADFAVDNCSKEDFLNAPGRLRRMLNDTRCTAKCSTRTKQESGQSAFAAPTHRKQSRSSIFLAPIHLPRDCWLFASQVLTNLRFLGLHDFLLDLTVRRSASFDLLAWIAD